VLICWIVQPGDSITSTFTLDSNGYWTDAWSVSGSTSQSGSTANSFSEPNPYVQIRTET
jgi:hypothetical protein